ncbi:hypothetical protein HW532_15645 [Kaustia mangrovi]|uniref:Terminase small subunit n=1 Tax=Kaustia mangrovi TaxID=2593653 RepID=A0A7S8C5Y8_9HYPH|nr:hypothetical protein [Kaustia mangrovi]QPC43997.1 hypothetical protein HW532_15645 [Kaustia mangrovi]
MAEDGPLSIRAYARHRGVTQGAVQWAIREGRLSKSLQIDDKGRKKIRSAAEADAEWLENTQYRSTPERRAAAEKLAGHRKGEAPKKAKTAKETAPKKTRRKAEGDRADAAPIDIDEFGEDEEVHDTLTLTQAQRIEKIWAARKRKLDYEREAGKLVSVDEVQRQAFETARATRDAILSIPDRISSLLAAEVDPARVNVLLADELRKALEGLADAGNG